MHLGLKFKQDYLSEDNLRFARQLGVTHIVVHSPRLLEAGALGFSKLTQTREFIESFDLKWEAIENLTTEHWPAIVQAGPQRDQGIRNVCTSIENMGKAGIPILGYYFSLRGGGHWRAYDKGGGRGDAGIKSFDYETIKNAPPGKGAPASVEEMWDRLAYFLERVVPVAEQHGVKLAAHPNDPPAETMMGVGNMLTSHEAMQRHIDLVPSPNNGLEFCQGTVAQMGPDKTIDAIRRFASQEKIFYVHFRNVRGAFPKFDEVFIDEGDVNMIAALKAYKDAGFDGIITPDHSPRVVGDTDYHHRGKAFALGYIRAALQALDTLD